MVERWLKDGRNDEWMALLHRCHYGGGCPVRSILNCNNCYTATQQGELTRRLTDNYTIINVLQKKKKKFSSPFVDRNPTVVLLHSKPKVANTS